MNKIKLFLITISSSIFTFLNSSHSVAQETSSQSAVEMGKALTNSAVDVVSAQLDAGKDLVNMVKEFFVKYSFQVLGGLITLVIGWIVAGYICKLLSKFLEKKKIDVTVSKFMVGTIKFLIMLFAVIMALGKFGIEMAPLIAGLSVAGVGISFALQGPLSNFAAGITLIFTKPFKVGDIVEVAGVMGEILDMKLGRTDLKTVDGTMIVVPNRHIIGEIIHNYSQSKRLDLNVGVSYSSDVDRAIEIVKNAIKNDKRVVQEPKVGISEFADSSVNIYARVKVLQDNYWDAMFDLNRIIFEELKKSNIEIPFPQRDVHLYEKK